MCVCYAVYSNLYLVILGFDDKFSQSSRFCWGSNFSSLFKFRTSQSYLVPDFKNKIDLSRIFQALSSNWVPLFGGGSFGGYTEDILFTSPRLEIISRSRWGIFWTTEEMTMSWDSWPKSIQLCPLSENDELLLHSPPPPFVSDREKNHLYLKQLVVVSCVHLKGQGRQKTKFPLNLHALLTFQDGQLSVISVYQALIPTSYLPYLR